MKTSVSFEFEGSNTEVISHISELMTKLDPAAAIIMPDKVKASRPKRVLTEAERQAIRDRFAAGKAKAALARLEVVVPVPVVEAKAKSVGAKPTKDIKVVSKPVAVKPISKALPMPVRGRKVKAKRSSQ